MKNEIQVLDCTLRDGAYITDSHFGTPEIKGIIKRMQDANIDLIECGWLKDKPHVAGSTFYHVPADLEAYNIQKSCNSLYVAMIDWDRYDLSQLPAYDGKSIDAIRVAFPHKKFREAVALGPIIQGKGYQVFFQAANTLEYSENDLIQRAQEVNKIQPSGLSVVDTFGAMYPEDMERIVRVLNKHVDKNIKLGFHSHNNLQLSFALSMQFVRTLRDAGRSIIVDASLCGMGRGAGNTTTELLVNYLNREHHGNYDLNTIMDAIDMYMGEFQKNYSWGYSTPYLIAGMYCSHVNNIAYLLDNHRTNSKELRNIIESLSPDERRKYDYGLLEQKYIDNQNRVVNDDQAIAQLRAAIASREVLLLCPGKSILKKRADIEKYIADHNPVIIGINVANQGYRQDYLFFCNSVRYSYAKEVYADEFKNTKRIITSNIKTTADYNESVINFNLLVKRGWEHFDNAGIVCLRLLNKLQVARVALAGFDGFESSYDESYADSSLPHIVPGKTWSELNEEIRDMLCDFRQMTAGCMDIAFITESKYQDFGVL